MASFDYHAESGCYHIRFRYAGRPFKRSLKLDGDGEAARVCGVIEETLKDLKRGRVTMPGNAEPGAFLLSGGKVESKPTLPVSETCQLATLFDAYEKGLPAGSKESNTLDTEKIHRRHLEAHFGEVRVQEIDHEAIQEYVSARAATVGVKTIRLELGTLRMLWNWGHVNGKVPPLPWTMKQLRFPKGNSREPFQTWELIERRIAALKKPTEDRIAALWECLYLDEEQVQACLAHVREHAPYPFIYPMFAFCAYTGARRSEVLRSEREDWDFKHGTVAIRQKKSDTTKAITLRHVPIHPELSRIMKSWLRHHPGGVNTIVTSNQLPIGPRMATKYFNAALAGSKWAVIPGFHVFRHSLASIMATRGIDQRIINDILGHSTEDMVKRYRHLCPRKKEETVHQLFL